MACHLATHSSLADKAGGDARGVEHFVTLFDHKFLPQGMAMHESLMRHACPFRLWILCMDALVEEQLRLLSLPHTTLIRLSDIETPELLGVKPGRTRGEYCWTLTPFTFSAVFDSDATVERVTYLDADVFLFDDPRVLLKELDESGKKVLITEHAYAPEYEYLEAEAGRFCVQFLTISRSDGGQRVMRWWQQRCLEWCFNRHEDGKFGDQRYLEVWPTLFADTVHVVQQTSKTLAPWNVRYISGVHSGKASPVIFHFHGLRIIAPDLVRTFLDYRIGREGKEFYDAYVSAVERAVLQLHRKRIVVPTLSVPEQKQVLGRLRRTVRCFRGVEGIAKLHLCSESGGD